MCGIVGFYSTEKKWSRSQLDHAVRSLDHRGRDANATTLEKGGEVGLGHHRLSILGLSEAANQPFAPINGKGILTYNGELYNYKALAKELSIVNSTESDTEVIAEMFSTLGTSSLNQFNGMFSFGYYNRETAELTLVRDRIGIKPLFYYWDGTNLAFASETKALLALGIPKEVDPISRAHYFSQEYIPGNRSIFKNVYKLRPGHFLTCKDGKIKIEKYYDLLDHLSPNKITKEQAIKEYGRLVSDAVKLRLASDVPLGGLLSGGCDSSIVCAEAANKMKERLNTYYLGFGDKTFDESMFARDVAKELNTNHHEQTITANLSVSQVCSIIQAYDEPFASQSSLSTTEVCRQIRKTVKVALSGDGGDEEFMGYGYYGWMKRLRKVEQTTGNTGNRVIGKILNYGRYRERRAARIFSAYGKTKSWPIALGQEQEMFNPDEIIKLTGKSIDLKALTKTWDRVNSLAIGDELKVSIYDLLEYLPHNLLYKVDTASMQHNLEVRVPLLDHRLVEFALSLPTSFKIKGAEQKVLMKEFLATKLPRHLVYRKKWGFPAPINDWMLSNWDSIVKTTISRDNLVRVGLVPTFALELLQKYENGDHLNYKRIWSIFVYIKWHEKYMD